MSRPRLGPRPLSLAVLAAFALHGCGPFDMDSTGPGPSGPSGPTGPTGPAGDPPPSGFAADMLSAHNGVRADPASVGGSPAPRPELAPLVWSGSAAATAQAWADGCAWGHNSGRGNLGENIAAATSGHLSTAEVVRMWAAEARFYDYAANACASGEVCGHYTQLVWRSTTAVGCGFRTCTTGSPFGSGSWDYWVCDYAPPGNYVGQRPY